MTIIYKKSLLTLTITVIIVAGVFLMSPILVDAIKKQICPSGKFMTGIDEKGNIICSTLPAGNFPNTYRVIGPNTEVLGGGGIGIAQAVCSEGDRALSGGFSLAPNIKLLVTGPSGFDNNVAWFATAQSTSEASSFLSASVLCADLTP